MKYLFILNAFYICSTFLQAYSLLRVVPENCEQSELNQTNGIDKDCYHFRRCEQIESAFVWHIYSCNNLTTPSKELKRFDVISQKCVDNDKEYKCFTGKKIKCMECFKLI